LSIGNGSRPRPRGWAISRRARLLIGGSVALLIAIVLLVPVVLTGSGTLRAKPCTQSLTYQRHDYVARLVTPGQLVQGVAIGIGVASGCGAPPANVNIRSLGSVKPTAAIGVAADQSSIYVRRGLCARSSSRELLACLRASR
jgi:hypothetical protein